ncbi:hypothetical protein Arub01_26690 [Actinomadura rubrobrunea]|uniref:Uncharacterized protein n=1 Tax=Actinomadura rubrobrunea TaxID=115335 RepID=A0A9W6PV65_9ACTN|nr:hypothetical protein Arub01_26690 [Actinomadura rubrobrunea]
MCPSVDSDTHTVANTTARETRKSGLGGGAVMAGLSSHCGTGTSKGPPSGDAPSDTP